MWKILFVLTALLALCTAAGCDVTEMSTLRDITRPYTGVYACEELRLGGEDVSDGYAPQLELEYGGTFRFLLGAKRGGAEEWCGTYEVDLAKEEITLHFDRSGERISRTYRMEDGAILVDENFLGRTLVAKFRMG